MSDFKLCENGHYFPKNLDECPYCPKPSQDKGQIGGGNIIVGGGNDQSNFPRSNRFKVMMI